MINRLSGPWRENPQRELLKASGSRTLERFRHSCDVLARGNSMFH